MAKGGQFALANRGQFTPVLGGQFNWIFHNNGIKNGLTIKYFENGKIHKKENFSNGYLLSEEEFDINGTMVILKKFDPFAYSEQMRRRFNRHISPNTYWYSSGEKLATISFFTSDYLNGTKTNQIDPFNSKIYYRNGKIKTEFRRLNSEYDIEFEQITYSEDGKIVETVKYITDNFDLFSQYAYEFVDFKLPRNSKNEIDYDNVNLVVLRDGFYHKN